MVFRDISHRLSRIRVQITNEGAKLSVAVTDIRLYDPATLAPREAALHWLNQAVLEGCVLTVGVGRPYQDPEGPDPEHWLQVNNIHPASDPLWRTCP